jgi:hypothetical protein
MAGAGGDILFTRYEGRRGFAWLGESYAMFRRHRLAWIGMVLAYYIALIVVDKLPLIGGLAVPLLKPILSIGFLAAAWTQERGGKPTVRLLLRGFRANVVALLLLGVVFGVGISIAVAATALVDGGLLLDTLYDAAPAADADPSAAARHVQETFMSPRVQLAMLFGVLCALPTILAMWWAPALVVFQDAGVRTALGASLRAAVANWRSALAYGFSMFLLGAVVPTFVTTALALIVPPPLNATLAAFLVLPYLAFFVATLHISDYVSYRDVFHAGEALGSEL